MENKTGKYFKYAIGEIILVVIGILIALSINNWNDNRKNSQKEYQYLQGLKKDLESNLLELDRVISKTAHTVEASDSILRHKREEIDSLKLHVFFSCLLGGESYTVYTVQEGTIQDIMGSGNLDIIKNDSIRRAIGSWQANLNFMKEWERLDKNVADDYAEYLNKNIDMYKMANPNLELPITLEEKERLINDRLFLNFITNRSRLPLILNQSYKNEVERVNNLIHLINLELKRF
jgi:hypothetical protein